MAYSNKELTIKVLLNLVKDTYRLDETGDANIVEYLGELAAGELDYLGKPEKLGLREFLIGFLGWANGPQLDPIEE